MLFVKQNYDKIQQPKDNVELCKLLDIEVPKDTYHNYRDKDIKVYAYVWLNIVWAIQITKSK